MISDGIFNFLFEQAKKQIGRTVCEPVSDVFLNRDLREYPTAEKTCLFFIEQCR